MFLLYAALGHLFFVRDRNKKGVFDSSSRVVQRVLRQEQKGCFCTDNGDKDILYVHTECFIQIGFFFRFIEIGVLCSLVVFQINFRSKKLEDPDTSKLAHRSYPRGILISHWNLRVYYVFIIAS